MHEDHQDRQCLVGDSFMTVQSKRNHRYTVGGILYCLLHPPSVVIGTAIMQRKLSVPTSIVSFFANMLPIKTVICETKTFVGYLAQSKQSPMVCLSPEEDVDPAPGSFPSTASSVRGGL
ncbi:hypothetical protein BU15DRAFT_84060 [Melanogaster broomeanus]|nr:hypothetical protein BU15DRAFT_84062 [Melanogaster broomeanus]KAF9230091.1 hypothetical protein BU15DRAFT_84060 [Melanogaster broomeanus]